jgi:hypothetical protein
MKNLYLSLLLLMGFSSSATHVVGGEITFEHVSGTFNTYRVKLCIYHDLTGIPLGNTQNISYSSSCNAGGSVSLALTNDPNNGDTLSSAYGCAGSNQPGSVYFAQSCYEGDIILPTNCSDWLFNWNTCCRNPSISNLQDPDSKGIVIEATLNNNFGQNSSPQFLSPAPRQFCLNVNQPIVWINDFVETDGDSIFVEFGQPTENGGTGNNPVPLPWETGYSMTNPFSSLNGVFLNSKTGSISFTPIQAEVAVVRIDLSEFRFNALSLSWQFVGKTSREVQIPIVANCNIASVNWSTQADTSGGMNNDTLTLDCGDQDILLGTSTPFLSSSLSSDGSDFLIYRSDGTLLPIVGASSINSSTNFSSVIKLALHDTLNFNDTMYLVSHIGSDFNTLTNYCGFDLPSGDSIVLVVKNCSGIGLTEGDERMHTQVFPNPSSHKFRVQFLQGDVKELKVYDLRGQLVMQKSISNKEAGIDLTDSPNGIYILEIQASGWSESMKLLKN